MICESRDGSLTVSVGSGLTDANRKDFMTENLVDKIVAVKYNSRITNSAGEESLFLPIFLELREDKTEADLNEEIK